MKIRNKCNLGVFLMFNVNGMGMIVGDSRVKEKRFPVIERSSMEHVRGLIIHQTDSEDEFSVFASYARKNANGAHFLIAKNGGIYQTASLFQTTRHVGKIKARCMAEHRCTPAEVVRYRKFSPDATNRLEMVKTVPQRYPSNFDSVGIEVVGKCRLPAHIHMPAGLTDIERNSFVDKFGVYDPLTTAQQGALQYLLRELVSTLHVPLEEIHRHPDVSYKQKTEAATAVLR